MARACAASPRGCNSPELRGSCRGRRPPRQTGVRAIFSRARRATGRAGRRAANSPPRRIHDMRSASKSVISLLVGIAIDRKLIASADEPVVKFFPEYQAVKHGGMGRHHAPSSPDHVLGHQVGRDAALERSENDEPHLAFDADPLRYVLSKPVAAPPDTLWTYNGGGTDLLGNILERVSGKSLEAFAREALFAAARHHRCRMEELSEERQDRGRGRPSPAPARCAQRSASSCSIAARGTASRSSRRTGSKNRSRRASRPPAISAARCSMAINGGWAARCPTARK